MSHTTIPHTIHYIWFGHGKHTRLQKKCMKSWKKYCPDYDIVLWNEDNFDISKAPLYVQQAYEAKKWAFVSDYVRLWVLYQYGGVYFDTDTEVLKDISHLLQNEAFIAFEGSDMVTTGVMGCCKENAIVKEILDSYDSREFYNENGEINSTVTGHYATEIFLRHGLEVGGKEQMVENWKIYPFTYFYPVKVINSNTYYTDNTCIVHWFEGTWISEENAKARAHDLNPFIQWFRKTKISKLYYKFRG